MTSDYLSQAIWLPQAVRLPQAVWTVLKAVVTQASSASATECERALANSVASSRGHEVSAALSPGWQPYLERVTHSAYRITDGDIEQLKAQGYSEEEIFELTIATALGAGLARLECGLAAVQKVQA